MFGKASSSIRSVAQQAIWLTAVSMATFYMRVFAICVPNVTYLANLWKGAVLPYQGYHHDVSLLHSVLKDACLHGFQLLPHHCQTGQQTFIQLAYQTFV